MSAGVAVAKASAEAQLRQDPAEQRGMDVDSREAGEADEDLYTRLKTLQRQLEFLEIQVGRLGPRNPAQAWPQHHWAQLGGGGAGQKGAGRAHLP